MEIRYTDEEINELLIVLVRKMAAEVELPAKDKAMLKRWRSAEMRLGSDDLTELTEKANEDFARGLQRRSRSQIRKPDWRQ